MPFQDEDESRAIDVPKAPSTFERLMRRVFVEDLGLKLLALAITLMIWLAVTSENTPKTITTGIQLNFTEPHNLEISNDPPRTVSVLLNGSRQKLGSINSLDLVATVDISDLKAGERVVRLSSQRVAIALPEGVKIESFQPATIHLLLEPRVERQLEVEVKIDGEPPEGFEVYGTQAKPAMITIQGPMSHVNSVQRAPTETISIEGKTESFSVPHALIDVADQKVEILSTTVEAVIEIGEKRIEKRFENVQVHSRTGAPVLPSAASVTLIGPARAVEQLRLEDIRVIVDKSSGGDSRPQIELPPALKQQVKLLSIKPAVFQ